MCMLNFLTMLEPPLIVIAILVFYALNDAIH